MGARQLAHNVWDSQLRRSKVQVVYNFGREDAANREALQRLAASLTRFLEPERALAAAAEGLEFTESRPAGGHLGTRRAVGSAGHRPGNAQAADGPPPGRHR
jgi:hypothetical protein